jgi:hypothetical protein
LLKPRLVPILSKPSTPSSLKSWTKVQSWLDGTKASVFFAGDNEVAKQLVKQLAAKHGLSSHRRWRTVKMPGTLNPSLG